MGKSKEQLVDDIVISSEYGVITQTQIEQCIDNFMLSMNDVNDLYKNGHKSFNLLLMYLYKHCIKYVLGDKLQHDYILLDNIFINIYIPLTYRFNRIASVNNFSILVNIDYSLFYDIKNGCYRSNNHNVTLYKTQIIKKWINICNGELIDNVMHTGNIGAMFVAKTRGFREEQQNNIQVNIELPQIDAKQLAAIAQTNIPGRDHE